MINTVTPFELYDHKIILPVTINGTGPLDFILDTSIRTTRIDVLTAERLGAARGADTLPGPLTLEIDRAGIEVERLRVEPLNETLALPRFGRSVAGVIGADLLGRAVCSLDYDNRQIMLVDPADFAYIGGGIEVALTGEPQPIVTGQVTIGGAASGPGRFLLDTAARAHLMLSPAFTEKNNLSVDGPRAQWSDRADTPHALARADVTAGPLMLPGLVAALGVSVAGIDDVDGIDGVIGAEVFQHFRVVLDQPGNRALFEITERTSFPYRFDASGMTLAYGDERPVVRHVMAASPAEAAGVLPGDFIEMVQDIPVEKTTLAAIRVTLRGAGETVTLRVQRGRESHELILTLRTLV